MLSLPTLQTIRLTPLRLLDISYVVVFLPLLLIIKAPMLLFVFLFLVLLYFQKEKASNLLVAFVFIIGSIAIFLSLYGAFSFSGLSRLKLFLELLVSILIVVVAMQRLTRTINFYLLFSPMLFLALSLFFFYGMVMLIYVIFEIFFLLWMVLAHRMEGDIVESFRASMVMFMYSLPWVVVLFIFFPRISFDHATYGFKAETIQRMGHDGTMFLDNKALLVPSDRIVMEVGFDTKVPMMGELYFRGSTLYVDEKDHWSPLPSHLNTPQPFLRSQKEVTDYQITLYPTQKRWLYLLDMPSQSIDKASLDGDLISRAKKIIKEPIHYAGHSILSPYFEDSLSGSVRKITSHFDANANPRTYQESQKIKASIEDDAQKAKAIIDFFHRQNLTYSLKPAPENITHTTDGFLFDKRYGYCVHFASAFATMARMVDIPSRIVTGYKSDGSNALNTYLAVKERDAHAWVELYIGKRWTRYEATNGATNIINDNVSDNNTQEGEEKESEMMKKFNLYLMYIKYQVETWILYYSNIRQLQLIQYAKNNPQFILYFVLSLLALVIATFSLVLYFRRPRCHYPALCALYPLLKKLKKRGFIRAKSETLHHYFLRYADAHPEDKAILEVDNYYEMMTYGGKKEEAKIKILKRWVKEVK